MRFKTWLEATKEDFFHLADSQRGKPEVAMREFQVIMGGGIMSYATEHIGDLTHRMSEKPTFGYGGYGYVKRKVENCLNILKQRYGFEREFEENIKNNAIHFNTNEEELRAKVYSALERYADEHEKLKTHNDAQENAKQAAVNLGRRNYSAVIGCLEELNKHLGTEEEWIKYAHEGLST